MKQNFYLTLFICIISLFFLQNSHAVNTMPPSKDVTVESIWDLENVEAKSLVGKKQLRKEKRLERRVKRLEKYFKSKNERENIRIDLRDHTEKWMWFWIIGWAVGALISIPGVLLGSGLLNLFSGLFFLAGTVCLIIWLVKKFA